MDNLKFFALAYLNDWWQYDRNFVAGLCPSQSRKIRLQRLNEAATYYQVIRRFPKKKDGAERLGKVLDLLDAALEGLSALTQYNVDVAVRTLAEKFNEAYEQGIEISAASKFLWIRHKTPVVIYDARAYTCLERLGSKIGTGYADYRGEWLKQFDQREEVIRSACAELVRVRDCSPDDETDESFQSTIASRWFCERVFDKFLLVERRRLSCMAATALLTA